MNYSSVYTCRIIIRSKCIVAPLATCHCSLTSSWASASFLLRNPLTKSSLRQGSVILIEGMTSLC